MRRLCTLALTGLALTACAPKHEAAKARQAAAEALLSPAPAPLCKTEGCCKGHGEVSHVQSDFLVICTDGQSSEICDCHR